MLISKASELDAKIDSIRGYSARDLQRDLNNLIEYGRVEVGWREACGKTDISSKSYREWKKIIKMLEKEGIKIDQISVIHPNKSPTMAQGFWNSIVFTIID